MFCEYCGRASNNEINCHGCGATLVSPNDTNYQDQTEDASCYINDGNDLDIYKETINSGFLVFLTFFIPFLTVGFLILWKCRYTPNALNFIGSILGGSLFFFIPLGLAIWFSDLPIGKHKIWFIEFEKRLTDSKNL